MSAINTVFYPYYGHLNTTGRRIYEELLPGIMQCRTKIPISVSVRAQAVYDAVEAIYNDHPEIFWLSGSTRVWTRNDIVTDVEPGYRCDAGRVPAMQRSLDSAVSSYLAAVRGKNPLDQERLIHDRMTREITYVHSSNDQTAYGSLVERRAVCAGYTRGFQLLMQKIGIPCYYCSGTGLGKGGSASSWGPHAWNILKLGDAYYNMDITWDDCYDQTAPGKISYTYYNCDDSVLAGNHRRNPACAFLPVCNGKKFSFQGVTGTDPNLEVIYQDGVTDRRPVRSVREFDQNILPVITRSVGRTTNVSFPANLTCTLKSFEDQMSNSLRAAIRGRSFSWTYSTTDYKNGWYRIELTVQYR